MAAKLNDDEAVGDSDKEVEVTSSTGSRAVVAEDDGRMST